MIAAIVVIAALLGYALYQLQRQAASADQRIDALLSAHREEVKALVDQVVLLKIDPPMAAIQAIPMEQTGPAHISATDDEALAAYEDEHRRLLAETRELVEQHAEAAA